MKYEKRTSTSPSPLSSTLRQSSSVLTNPPRHPTATYSPFFNCATAGVIASPVKRVEGSIITMYVLLTFSIMTLAQSPQLAPGATAKRYVRESMASTRRPGSPIERMTIPQSLLAFTELTVSRASSVNPSTIIPTVVSFSKSIGRISRAKANVIKAAFAISSKPSATSTTS